MLDYKLLAALAAVIEQGGFERGAQALALSQSAVSQRIKLLEARVGAPVLIRSTPPQPTPAGRRLLNHVQQVRLLEGDLKHDIPMGTEGDGPSRLRIALNADSLATWWSEAVAPLCEAGTLLLDQLVDDQAVGLRRMRAGEVAGCVCASAEPVAGARALYLGDMHYLAVASPAYLALHLPDGVNPSALGRAPAIVFGPDDTLQHRFLARQGWQGDFPYHLCPSSEGFVRLVQAGMGWGMVPALQASEALGAGKLVELVPGFSDPVPLYWHYWRNGGMLLETLTKRLAAVAPRLLNRSA